MKLTFQKLLNDNLPLSSRVIVALSGGADSVALLSLVASSGRECIAVHCNYGLRGEESDRDELHARRVAEQLGVSLRVYRCDVEARRRDNPGESIEMACRELRYDIFRNLLEETHFDVVALGHHREDNIETLMLNLLRGSGVKGLSGMSTLNGVWARPLLNVSKTDILDYLAEVGLDYVTDSSNLSCDYRRNALRNAVLPLVEQHFPSAQAGLSKTIQALGNQQAVLSEAVTMMASNVTDPDGGINLAHLVELTDNPTAWLFEILNYPDYQGFHINTVRSIVDNVDKSGLRFTSSLGVTLRLDHGRLLLDVSTIEDVVIEWNITEGVQKPSIKAEQIGREQFAPCRDNNVAWFDAERVPRHVILRHPKTGDRIAPYGMKGSRLLSDIFNDLKLPHEDRLRAWVMVDPADGRILWLPGIRASRHYAVTPASAQILKLTFS